MIWHTYLRLGSLDRKASLLDDDFPFLYYKALGSDSMTLVGMVFS